MHGGDVRWQEGRGNKEEQSEAVGIVESSAPQPHRTRDVRDAQDFHAAYSASRRRQQRCHTEGGEERNAREQRC